MAKQPTYPTLYDNLQTLSISFLKQWGYLKQGQYLSGTVSWYIGEGENRQVTAQIRIIVSLNTNTPYIELIYTCNGKPFNYRVPLAVIQSNLGKGIVWYFLCPQTGRRCRKLYLAGCRFMHREAFRGMYRKQTQSKRWRLLDSFWDAAEAREHIHSRYFKTHYNGKPTKRYLKMEKKLNKTLNEKAFLTLLHF